MKEKRTSRRTDTSRRIEPFRDAEAPRAENIVAGRNAVLELLKSGRGVDKIYIQNGAREGSVTVIVAEAAKRGIPTVDADRRKLDALCGGVAHQGVAALASEIEYAGIEDILRIADSRGEAPFIVIADSINDPHNLGALIRSACCAGAHGVIIPKRRAVQVTPAVIKASAGAIEHIAVARVPNLAAAVDELKEKNVWLYAVEADGRAVLRQGLFDGRLRVHPRQRGRGRVPPAARQGRFCRVDPDVRRREFAQRVGGGLGRDFRGGAPAAWRGPEELIF